MSAPAVMRSIPSTIWPKNQRLMCETISATRRDEPPLARVRASGEATKSSRAAAASTRSRVLGATP